MKLIRRLRILMLVLCSIVISAQLQPAHARYDQFVRNYCTWYAAQKFDQTAPDPKCNWGGNANEWLNRAFAAGWQTTTSGRGAVQGAVVVWYGGRYGHVAYVEQVSDSGIFISEMNWGSLSPPGNVAGITTNFGKVTTAFLGWNNLSRGGYNFAGYVLPVRRDAPTPLAIASGPQGVWSLQGSDIRGTKWIATLVIMKGEDQRLTGHVDWLGTTGHYGREHLTCTYNPQNNVLLMTGSRIEFGRGIGLGQYRAVLSADGSRLENGTWSDSNQTVVPGSWSAKRLRLGP